ncbi:WD40 repeat-like protein [Mycena sp. CBHHK59/15]|nr:WD40 repeat-like protein [Mycena sp. CBHHK59/15]
MGLDASASNKVINTADTITNASEAGGTLISGLEAVITKLDMIVRIHPYAHAAWLVLTSVYKVVKTQEATDNKLLKLVQTMVEVYLYVEEIGFISQKKKGLEETVLGIVKQTAECAIFIQEYTGSGFWTAQGLWSGASEKIDELTAVFIKLKGSFDTGVAIQTAFLSTEIFEKVEILEMLQHLSPMLMNASSRPECLPGTRQEILDSIIEWVMVPSSSANVLWLSGVAGSGKSTISTTIAESFRALQRLGAFLFFDRNDQRGNDLSAVIHTIAHKLALLNPHLRAAICDAIKVDPGVVNAPIHTQFKKLLFNPLVSAQSLIQGPIVIILDALDEFGDSSSRAALVSLLSHDFLELPPLFRFFITSRRDSDIVEGFQCQLAEKHLDIGTPSSTTDVMSFLRSQTDDIRKRKNLGKTWPGEQNIQILTDLSAGLFIWASTAIKFLDAYHPAQRLQALMSSGSNQGFNLDSLYAVALQHSGPWEDETFASDAHAVLGAVILGRTPMSNCTIDRLLGLKEGRSSRTVLEYLGCVIQWSPGQSARTLHASFADYIVDKTRSGKEPWFLDTRIQSHALSVGCLQVLKNDLRFNICELEDSHRSNAEVLDLSSLISRFIHPALSYSSEFWAAHLEDVDFDPIILAEIKQLMETQLPYWLEVLSLTHQVGAASTVLTAAGRYVQGHDQKLVEFIADAKKFVTAFAPAILQSVPHIYLSAIPLSPHNSIIGQQYSAFFPHTLHFHGPLGDKWPDIQAVFAGHRSGVNCVVFSPDGTNIVSGSDDYTVRVWDAQTGHTVAGPFEGHTHYVRSVAFSPDGTRIVSGSSDYTVRVWDAQTGHTVAGPFKGHTSPVYSVTFSPDGKRIVTGSDNTVQVWDAQTSHMISGPFEGHSDWVRSSLGYSVAFSPDGTRIASGSDDSTVRVWDAQTGHTVAEPFEGHSGWVHSVAFSPDGTRIVSGSADHTVRVWDAQTGHTVAGPFEGHSRWVNSVAFSPDGTRIASGSDDSTVRVWDAQTGNTVAGPFEGHSSRVCSVAFSHDGTRIVSGSADDTVRVWDAQTGYTVAGQFEGHTKTVGSVAFSPDGKRIVSGSSDHTVQVWDAQTGHVAGSFEGHTSQVCSVAFSPDGMRIVSGSDDSTLQVWDAQAGHTVAGPFEGHTNWVRSVAFSPDGTRIVSGSFDLTVRVWDALSGHTAAGPFEGHTKYVSSVAFSRDGTRIVSGSADHTVRVWDAQTGHTVARPFEGHINSVCSVAFSPDGTRIVSGSADHTVRVWDAQTGHVAVSFEGHSNQVCSVAFSPDGTRIVSGSDDSTVQVWDAQTGHTIAGPFEGHTNYVRSVAFSPDGTRIVSGSCDHTVRQGPTSSKLSDYPTYKDGWMLNPPSDLICWIPPWLREGLYAPRNTLVIHRRGATKLDYTDLVHGTEWQKCIDPKFRAPKYSLR